MDLERAAEDFKRASDELRRPVTLEEIARECGVPVEDLRRAMLVEDSDAYRPPPPSWKEDLAYLARERAAELVELADELEASAWAPATKQELDEIGSIILNRFEGIRDPGDDTAVEEEGRAETDEPPAAIEERQEAFERKWAEIATRRADRKARREEEAAEGTRAHRERRPWTGPSCPWSHLEFQVEPLETLPPIQCPRCQGARCPAGLWTRAGDPEGERRCRRPRKLEEWRRP
jgi:hypothetical protein